jgi:hypothetical protein
MWVCVSECRLCMQVGQGDLCHLASLLHSEARFPYQHQCLTILVGQSYCGCKCTHPVDTNTHGLSHPVQ